MKTPSEKILYIQTNGNMFLTDLIEDYATGLPERDINAILAGSGGFSIFSKGYSYYFLLDMERRNSISSLYARRSNQ